MSQRTDRCNAATAIACIDRIQATHPITSDAIRQGVTSAHWPGRLQHVDAAAAHNCFNTHHQLYLDGGHNPAAAVTLGEWIRTQFLPVHLVLGMHHDKDIASTMDILMQHAASLTTVTIRDDPKSVPASELADIAHQKGHAAHAQTSLDVAIHSLTMTNPVPAIILVTGSLYLVGEALALLKAREAHY
jgi:dihydrofolate synthase / folylpolyglutamate synthase